MKPNQISENDVLDIEFTLDNPKRSEIRKFAKVIWLNDRIIGANFSETEVSSQALEFYLKIKSIVNSNIIQCKASLAQS